MDLNLETMSVVSKCLGLEFDYNETVEYFHEVTDKNDFRELINGKKRQFGFRTLHASFRRKTRVSEQFKHPRLIV